jgi:hypothetical protein
MARKQSEAAIRAAKEAKQKKLLILLIVPFIALLAWQGPKTYKALMGGSPPPESTPLPLPATTPAGTSPLPGQPTQAGELPDTDPQPTLLDGQLLSFSRFSGRDPFINRVPDDGSTSATAGATIEVNGESEDVGINDPFPASDPTFKLVSITDTAANIGLVSGSFSNGSDTITIAVGETLVLAADDGARYAIKIVSVAT